MISVQSLIHPDFSQLTVNEKEILRYLGVKKADDSVLDLIEKSKEELYKIVSPKAAYACVDIVVSEDTVDFEFMRVESKNLSKNLESCHKAFVFCATLGISVDRLYEKQKRVSQALATVMSATASSLIESFCDYVNKSLVGEEKAKPRFSCGYGDFALEHQKDILKVLEADKRLGVCLTESCMMVPVKSVTAIIGIRS